MQKKNWTYRTKTKAIFGLNASEVVVLKSNISKKEKFVPQCNYDIQPSIFGECMCIIISDEIHGDLFKLNESLTETLPRLQRIKLKRGA